MSIQALIETVQEQNFSNGSALLTGTGLVNASAFSSQYFVAIQAVNGQAVVNTYSGIQDFTAPDITLANGQLLLCRSADVKLTSGTVLAFLGPSTV